MAVPTIEAATISAVEFFPFDPTPTGAIAAAVAAVLDISFPSFPSIREPMNQGLESKGCLKKTTRGSRCQGNKKSGSRFFKQPPDSKPSAARLGFGQLIQATRALNNGADNFCMQVAVIQKFVLTCKHRSAYSERPLRSMALYSPFRQKLQLFNIN